MKKLIQLDQFENLLEIDLKSGKLHTVQDGRLNELFYLIEIETFDTDRIEFNDKCNISIKVKPTDDSKLRPVVMAKLKNEKENKVILFKRNLREKLDDNSNNFYVVDIVRADDPLKLGLNYYLETLFEMVNNTTDLIQSSESLFSIDQDSGVIKAIKPRSFYKSDVTYKLKLKITSKINET